MILNNKKLKGLLEERNTIVQEARGITRQIEELEAKRAKMGLKLEKIKDKVKPILEKEVKLEDEFDEIGTVAIENGEVVVTIFNKVDEFKKALRQQKVADSNR